MNLDVRTQCPRGGSIGFDSDNPSSINGALTLARENAKRAREVISTELYEELNRAKLMIDKGTKYLNHGSYHEYFTNIRRRVATIDGLINSTLSIADVRFFLDLGTYIERADMTARLILTGAELGSSGSSWVTLLRSCGAHEAYLRTVGSLGSDQEIANFLLLNPAFPRSLLFALQTAESRLTDLTNLGITGNLDTQGSLLITHPKRELGLARVAITYRPLTEVLASLPSIMLEIQKCISRASSAIRDQYFPTGSIQVWMGEQL
jgi:uncharacterized alpha-E superfamily protein